MWGQGLCITHSGIQGWAEGFLFLQHLSDCKNLFILISRVLNQLREMGQAGVRAPFYRRSLISSENLAIWLASSWWTDRAWS